MFKKKAAILITISILIIGVVLGIFQYKKSQELKLVNQVISQATEKINESENYLVYGDKEKAINTLGQASELLNSVNTNLKKNEVEKIKKEVEIKISEVLNRKTLTDLKPIFEIKEEKATEKWQSDGLVIDEKNIYVYSENSATVYKWNLDERYTKTLKQKAKVLGGTLLDKKIFFLLAPSSFVINEKEKTLPIEFPYENFNITQINGYLNFLYVLDGKEGEIAKYKVSESSVDTPSLWLKQRNVAKTASSFAIDGNIYILFPDGKIKKFTSGNLKEEIESPKTYPKIKSAAKIYTSNENKYLYIADPESKRIIVEDKKGNVIAEYQSDNLNKIKDIFVDAQDKNIYVLSENKVFQIEL